MAIKTTNVTVTTAATALVGTDTDSIPGQGISLLNGATAIYVGGADVTADAAAGTGGRLVAAGATFEFDTVSASDVPYARTASGSSVVNVFRVGG